ncbi:hypothetical protein M8J76_012017 [Diaphorina citri]|nr:hypothetical protein M8J75_009804 [Diaphorina citri]KAI5730280.1 hypothetical protein M8J76_012017 [Diaphorina citri]
MLGESDKVGLYSELAMVTIPSTVCKIRTVYSSQTEVEEKHTLILHSIAILTLSTAPNILGTKSPITIFTEFYIVEDSRH